MKREFNSCDDVVHSTHLDYPLSPLHSIISFFFMISHVCVCMRPCVCVCAHAHTHARACAKVSQGQCSSEGLFSDKWTSHIVCNLTAATLRPFTFLTKSGKKAQQHSDLCSLLIQSAATSFRKLIARSPLCHCYSREEGILLKWKHSCFYFANLCLKKRRQRDLIFSSWQHTFKNMQTHLSERGGKKH